MPDWLPQRVLLNELDELGHIDRVLRDWEPPGGCGGTLQAGDLGWKLRFGPVAAAESLTVWRAPAGEIAVVMCRDSPSDWWFAMDPALAADWSLAEALVRWTSSIAPATAIAIDGPGVPAVWRQALVANGFEATTDAWAHLWRPLSAADAVNVPGVESIMGEQAIADRVAVQRAAFANSTFTVEKWHAMAEGPSFRSEFDLLARDEAGAPVAAATVWLPGKGKCGLLEPMGTHPDHRRQGHGRRVIAAACAALARAGASGVCVATPESNAAAVALYRSAGFRRIGLLSAMVRTP